ncbi:MAG: 5-formyltetrahydrofolate cyclo-ligase [Planctomycetota bacterium]|jgi:5-formyltetrahydrofolate cyclo-ligase|nr:5-formyltetrahydrofolate cyclo-ligase [Planctomycetota bacterium]
MRENEAVPTPVDGGLTLADKASWRQAVKTIFRLIPPKTRQRLDTGLNERLRQYLPDTTDRILLAFHPLPDEPDLRPFLTTWIARRGSLGLPRWVDNNRLSFHRVCDLARDLIPGPAGILEPRLELPELPAAAGGWILVPGRAFSETGERLGRGAGCYDRLFPGISGEKIGIAYDFQVFPELPTDQRDGRVDVVLTPGRLLREGKGG